MHSLSFQPPNKAAFSRREFSSSSIFTYSGQSVSSHSAAAAARGLTLDEPPPSSMMLVTTTPIVTAVTDMDNKALKVTLDHVAADTVTRDNPVAFSSSRRATCVAAAIVGMLGVAIAIACIFSLAHLVSAHSMLNSVVIGDRNKRLGSGSVLCLEQQQRLYHHRQSLCIPNISKLVDASRLDSRRKGVCTPPRSLTDWVCEDLPRNKKGVFSSDGTWVQSYLKLQQTHLTAEALDRSLVPASLEAFRSACPLRAANDDDDDDGDDERAELGELRRNLVQEIDSQIRDETSWWRTLGVAYAFGIDAWISLDINASRVARGATPLLSIDAVRKPCLDGISSARVYEAATRPDLRQSYAHAVNSIRLSPPKKSAWNQQAFFDGLEDGLTRLVSPEMRFVGLYLRLASSGVQIPTALSLPTDVTLEDRKRYLSTCARSTSLPRRQQLFRRLMRTIAFSSAHTAADSNNADATATAASLQYMNRVFDQIVEDYSSSNPTATATATLQNVTIHVTGLWQDHLEKLSTAIAAIPSKNCDDFTSSSVAILQAANLARLLDAPFSSSPWEWLNIQTSLESVLFGSDLLFARQDDDDDDEDDEHPLTLISYQPAWQTILVSPMVLESPLYRRPSIEDPYGMVDVYGRFGWLLARELAAIVGASSSKEQLATCINYRVLCRHSPSACTSLTSEDVNWLRRYFWDIAASNCLGSYKLLHAIDAAAQAYPLYRVAFACNGLYPFEHGGGGGASNETASSSTAQQKPSVASLATCW